MRTLKLIGGLYYLGVPSIGVHPDNMMAQIWTGL